MVSTWGKSKRFFPKFPWGSTEGFLTSLCHQVRLVHLFVVYPSGRYAGEKVMGYSRLSLGVDSTEGFLSSLYIVLSRGIVPLIAVYPKWSGLGAKK